MTNAEFETDIVKFWMCRYVQAGNLVDLFQPSRNGVLDNGVIAT